MNSKKINRFKIVTAFFTTALIGIACSWQQVADVSCIGFLMVPAYFIILGLSNLKNRNNKK